MRKEQGITMITLAVTIIVLIILAGVSMNAIVGDRGIITMAQKAKENTELAKIEEEKQLNNLYMELQDNGASIEDGFDADAIERLENFKKVIATAITNEGVTTLETDTEQTMAENISKILQERTKDATATAEDIVEGKTAYANGEKITGTASLAKGIAQLDLIVDSSVTSTTTTSSTTDTIHIDVADYNQVLIVASMVGNHWTFTEGMSLNFSDILINDNRVWFLNLLHSTGGSGSNNGFVAYGAAIANCNANASNELKIVTKTTGINTSLTKYYKIYGIK